MKSISFLRLNCELTFCSRNSLPFTLMRNEFTILQIFYEFTIFRANSSWIHWIYDAYTINFAKKLLNQFRFCEFTVYCAEIPWMNNLSRENTLNSRDVSRIRYEYTIYFTISLKIHSMFREYTINSVFISQVHFEFTVESQIHCEFPNNFANLLNLYLSFSQKYHKFTIFLAIWLWIHCLLRWFIINTLSISRIYF